jgi:hypothetical protein
MDVPKADYSVVVRRYWDRSGILKVYQVNTGRFAYRLQAKKVLHPPEWVLSKLRAVDPKGEIGYEPDEYSDEDLLDPDKYEDEDKVDLTDKEIEMIDNYDANAIVNAAEARELVERVLEPADFEPAYDEPLGNEVAVEMQEPGEEEQMDLGPAPREQVVPDPDGPPPPRYPVRDRAPRRFIDHYVFAMTYEKAFKIRPDKALKALDTEIDNFEKNQAWHGVLREDLTKEQQGLCIGETRLQCIQLSYQNIYALILCTGCYSFYITRLILYYPTR